MACGGARAYAFRHGQRIEQFHKTADNVRRFHHSERRSACRILHRQLDCLVDGFFTDFPRPFKVRKIRLHSPPPFLELFHHFVPALVRALPSCGRRLIRMVTFSL